MNLKNHTGERYVVLQGEQSEVSTFTAGHTFPWYTKTLPATTGGRLATYLVGFLITVSDLIFTVGSENAPVDSDDLARALFESCELKNTLFGKPISHNYYKGSFFPLGGFIGNGMRRPIPQNRVYVGSSVPYTTRQNYFVPACSLLGLKGHHTAQLSVCYDGATFELKTASAGQVAGVGITSAKLHVTAILVSEPEIRLGPGTQFVRYEQTVGATATKHMIEALGNTGSLSGVDTGAGIAFLAWMTSRKGYGGSFAYPYNLEYINVPFRSLDQLVTLDPMFADYLGACGNNDLPPSDPTASGYGGPYPTSGCLYDFDYNGDIDGLLKALFVPLISPKRFMEVTKMQSVEGSQEVNAKITGETFAGQDVYYALQYHSWTPALQEQFLRKVVDSGVARAVWGTNDLKPKTKLLAKQPAGELNLAKTRYLPLTWEPAAPQVNPPGPASAK
jgi:hypothetical protein